MRHSWKHILAMLLAAAMLFALACPGFAAGDKGENTAGPVTVTWEKVEGAPRGLKAPTVTPENDSPYGPDDTVRVSIILEKLPTLRAGYSGLNIGANAGAQSYREAIRSEQISIADVISAKVLGGKKLDVVWNLTLAANLISANVPYKAVEAIKALPGVKDVIIETCYYPDEGVNMSNASQMVGGPQVWANGYTGAGSVVAIIDTGLDIDHELFQPDAFEYAIDQAEGEVDLLTADKIATVWDYLNASTFVSDPGDVYFNSKVPFGANYVDLDLDITHQNDSKGEHGSHVAGIAAANRFVKVGGEFKNSLETVYTQGEAPDAQVLVMKVFGKGGGAYDSDYMAAIEDAIVLGADSVNLSLGSASAGFATPDSAYSQYVMNAVTYTDTVVAISAGNASNYNRQQAFAYMYSDGANYDTVGSPGSFTNSLCVASVDNDGVTGKYLSAYGEIIFYSETSGYGNTPIASIAGEYDFVYIDSPGVDDNANVGAEGDDFLAAGSDLLSGKIAICNRGSSSFFAKANAAIAQGAVAVIIANNQSGVINMNLTGYKYTAPAVSITQADGAMLKANATKTTVDGVSADVYLGKITVADDIYAGSYNSEYYTMSNFSSWGVPGDLSLKPEITAPGGNIYSINGMDHTYESMSGTSMASPQIAGLAAVMAQYIRENDLCAKTGLTQRQLINSLLMSTAEPLIDPDGYLCYYPVIKQGAGLADVDAATNAHSYIIMGDDATASAADGKVKVELGDDPDRTGRYSFTFDLNNLTDEDIYYYVDAEFFTQDVFQYYVYDAYGNAVTYDDGSPVIAWYNADWTWWLDADVTWTVNGELYVPGGIPELDFNADGQFDEEDAKALLEYVVNETPLASGEEDADLDGDGEKTTHDAYLALELVSAVDAITVPASGSVTIGVDVTLNDISDYDDCGAYVEGYVYAAELDSEDGNIGVVHSIPVIGYYGSWTEPTMHDVGSFLEFQSGEEAREPYMAPALGDRAKEAEWFGVNYGWIDGTYSLGGNPYEFDEEYMPERDAISPASTLAGVSYSLVRNSAGGRFTATVDGEELASVDIGAQTAAYYNDNDGKWYNTRTYTPVGLAFEGLKDGQVVELTYMLAPEYYLQEDGSVDWDSVYADSAMTFSAVVDGTAPEVADITPVVEDDEFTALQIDIEENRYIAAVVIWNEEGWKDTYSGAPLLTVASDPDAEEGAGLSLAIPNGEDGIDFNDEANQHIMIEVYDYAANYTTYKLNLNQEELDGGPTALIVTPAETKLIPGMTVKLTATSEPWATDESCWWRSYDGDIATVDSDGVVTAVGEGVVTIEAVSKANSAVSGTATIEVYYPEYVLNASLFDENSDVHFVSFNTKDLLKGSTDYSVLADTDAGIIDMSWNLFEDAIYAASLNDDFTSTLYTLDPATFELTEIGTDPMLAYLGMAPSLSFWGTMPGNVDMLTAYGPYIVGIDTDAGAYSEDAIIDLTGEIEGSNVVGVAYIEYTYLPNYGLLADDYFIIDDLSNVYFFEIMYSDGTLASYGYDGYEEGFHFVLQKIGTFNAPVSVDHYNSLYFDGENIFWSRFASSDEGIAEVYMTSVLGYDDNYYPVLGPTTRLGQFAEGVWPVGGLIEFGEAEDGSGEPDEGGSLTEDDFAARASRYAPLQFADGIESIFDGNAPRGSLNAITVEEVTSEDPEAPAEGAYKLILTADEANHNGLFTVEYDAEELELVSSESPITEYSVIKEEEGMVTIGYATLDEVAADDEILVLTFNQLVEGESTVTVTTEELGEEFPEEAEEEIIGSYEYGEPEWVWAEDYSSATAIFTCIDDDSITREVEATVTSETTDTETVYTAEVEFNGETYTDTQTVAAETPAPGGDTPAPGGDTPAPGGDNPPGGGSISDQPTEPEFPFEDVYESDWYYEAVYNMYKAGYIKGTSETTYEPNETITRGQIVTILYRIDGENKVESGVTFEDVKPGAFYYDAVAWANAKGIVNGYSETEFAPDDDITREQFAAIVYRYAKYVGNAVSPTDVSFDAYTDGGDVSDWAKEAMAWCVATKLIQGTGENALDPQSLAFRGQAAVIFDRMLKLFA